MSKVNAPNEFVVNFYYYFSYFTLVLCWILAPLVLYIILTQSKKLKTIKWLILNHSFWCLALETLLGLVKPLFIMPCPCGIQIGVFKNFGDFRNTAIATQLCILFTVNSIASLTATLISRYGYVFPSKYIKFLNSKTMLISLIGFSCILNAINAATLAPMLYFDAADIHKFALEYDPYFSKKYFNEQTFFIIPHPIIDRIAISTLVLMVLIIILFIIFSFYFIFLIQKYKKNTSTKLKRSLIISSFMQILLTNIFLNFPFLMLYIFIVFDVPNSSTIFIIFSCMITLHCLMEFITTLYFISPYRDFIFKFFKRKRLAEVKSKTRG